MNAPLNDRSQHAAEAVERALDKASRQVDDIFLQVLDNTTDMLTTHGATAEELAATLQWHSAALKEEKARIMMVLRAFLVTGTWGVH